MAQSSDAAGVVRCRTVVLGVILTLSHGSLLAQKRISLAELGKRNTADFAPINLGQKVVARGVVSAPAFHFPQYAFIAIQDGGYGAVLKLSLPDTFLDGLHPGDEVEAHGAIGTQFGMTVLELDSVVVLGHRTPPAPQNLSTKELQSFTHLGKLVRVEGVVNEKGYNAGGALVFFPG